MDDEGEENRIGRGTYDYIIDRLRPDRADPFKIPDFSKADRESSWRVVQEMMQEPSCEGIEEYVTASGLCENDLKRCGSWRYKFMDNMMAREEEKTSEQREAAQNSHLLNRRRSGTQLPLAEDQKWLSLLDDNDRVELKEQYVWDRGKRYNMHRNGCTAGPRSDRPAIAGQFTDGGAVLPSIEPQESSHENHGVLSAQRTHKERAISELREWMIKRIGHE